MIAVIDYGMGNIHSVQKALESQGAETLVTNNPRELDRCDKVVLPKWWPVQAHVMVWINRQKAPIRAFRLSPSWCEPPHSGPIPDICMLPTRKNCGYPGSNLKL